MGKNNNKPTINRYVLKINQSGEVIDTIELSIQSKTEKDRILSEIFLQGFDRLGYEHD